MISETDTTHGDAGAVTEASTKLRWIRWIVLLLVIVGCVVRFTGLGTKFFWRDEIHTGQAIAGTTRDEIRADLFDGRIHTRAEILDHQFPGDNTSVADTVMALVLDEPRHPPLYFSLAHLWVKTFGKSVGVLRSLSAVFGLLGLPLIFLLSRELFRNHLAGWVAVGWIAVSPLHIVFAQEARQYTLWIDLVMLASWSLLVAMRRSGGSKSVSIRWFALYSVAVALALYTHLLTLPVMAAHALFVVAHNRFRLTSTVLGTALALFSSVLLYSPWVAVVVADTLKGEPWIEWAQTPISLAEWAERVAGAYIRPFLDVQSTVLFHSDQKLGLVPLAVGALLGVVGLRQADRRARLLLLILGLVCSVPWIIADMRDDGWRSMMVRYQFPAVLTIQLSIAYAVTTLLSSGATARRRLGAAAATLLVGCGLVSAYQYTGSRGWWKKVGWSRVLPVADVINASNAPLVVFGERPNQRFYRVLTLSHQLRDDAKFQPYIEPHFPTVPEHGYDVFVWRASEKALSRFGELGWNVEPLEPIDLHRLSRDPSSSNAESGAHD
jgi:uncharacterized membrane protein